MKNTEMKFSEEQKKGMEIAEANLSQIPATAGALRQVADFIARQKDFCPVGDIKIHSTYQTEKFGAIELEGTFILRYEYTPQSAEPNS